MEELLAELFPPFIDESNELIAWLWKVIVTGLLVRYGFRRRTERKEETHHRSAKAQRYDEFMAEIERDQENGDASLTEPPNPHMDSATASMFMWRELKQQSSNSKQHRKTTDANFSDLRQDLDRKTSEIHKSIGKVSERVARMEGRRDGPK